MKTKYFNFKCGVHLHYKNAVKPRYFKISQFTIPWTTEHVTAPCFKVYNIVLFLMQLIQNVVSFKSRLQYSPLIIKNLNNPKYYLDNSPNHLSFYQWATLKISVINQPDATCAWDGHL